ncbi:hypothetical protein I598_1424 [Isoptericola dokdonensis DS-3]|jgi:hypothetical protein|uniref:Uncharacterized protein n=1 Tax=Isoptericola dokdonensis DS-3 TaxID=1300344 RepID=A0A161IKS3_9MICO|nr:hypothetical protein I598_1424 [Isoptericola dokdonensis DS-3]
MEIMKPFIGAIGGYTGENSALRGFEPIVRVRTRHVAGDPLASLAPSSATWSQPV